MPRSKQRWSGTREPHHPECSVALYKGQPVLKSQLNLKLEDFRTNHPDSPRNAWPFIWMDLTYCYSCGR